MFRNSQILYFIIFIFYVFNVYGQNISEKENYFYNKLNDINKKKNLDIILSDSDIKKYKNIFAIQKDGEWQEAEKIIDSLENKILLGHVKYQKLMHPTKYRSPYSELRDWLDLYNDHPMAERIWKLAKIIIIITGNEYSLN